MKGFDASRENFPADFPWNSGGNSAPMNGPGLSFADGASYNMAGAGAGMGIPPMNGCFSQGAQGCSYVPPQQPAPASWAPVAPQIQQPLMGQQMPMARQRSSGVLAPDTRGAKVSKRTVNKKATPPSHDKAAPRKVESFACEACRAQKIKCKPPDGPDSCNNCKKKGKECVRSRVDMRTNSSTITRHKEAVSYCESFLAHILCLTNEVSENHYRVDLVRAIEDTTAPLEEILPKFFEGADNRWPGYMQAVREKYHLPPADDTEKLAEVRAMFSKLEEVVLKYTRDLEIELVGSLAMTANVDPLFLEGLSGEDFSLACQLQDYGRKGGDVFQRLVCSPLEERVSKIFRTT